MGISSPLKAQPLSSSRRDYGLKISTHLFPGSHQEINVGSASTEGVYIISGALHSWSPSMTGIWALAYSFTNCLDQEMHAHHRSDTRLKIYTAHCLCQSYLQSLRSSGGERSRKISTFPPPGTCVDPTFHHQMNRTTRRQPTPVEKINLPPMCSRTNSDSAQNERGICKASKLYPPAFTDRELQSLLTPSNQALQSEKSLTERRGLPPAVWKSVAMKLQCLGRL